MLQNSTQSILSKVYAGMEVYDSEGDKMGYVRAVRFGTVLNVHHQPLERGRHKQSVVDEMADALHWTPTFPIEVLDSLQRYGYIVVDTGLFDGDRYVAADQIADVYNIQLCLNIPSDQTF